MLYLSLQGSYQSSDLELQKNKFKNRNIPHVGLSPVPHQHKTPQIKKTSNPNPERKKKKNPLPRPPLQKEAVIFYSKNKK
jgi:hypothetical protein